MAGYWEKFKGGPTKPASERMHITINIKGVLTFNRNVFRLLGSPRAAVLYYNKEESMIGVGPAHPELEEAFPVMERVGYWVINAAPFCRNYNISVPRTERFVKPDLDPEGILRLNLATTVSTGVIRKRKQKRD